MYSRSISITAKLLSWSASQKSAKPTLWKGAVNTRNWELKQHEVSMKDINRADWQYSGRRWDCAELTWNITLLPPKICRFITPPGSRTSPLLTRTEHNISSFRHPFPPLVFSYSQPFPSGWPEFFNLFKVRAKILQRNSQSPLKSFWPLLPSISTITTCTS